MKGGRDLGWYLQGAWTVLGVALALIMIATLLVAG